MPLHHANQILARHTLTSQQFHRLHQQLAHTFKGSRLGELANAINEAVGEAYEAKVAVGWLPEDVDEFDDLEYQIALLRQDVTGKRWRTLADLPAALREYFDDTDEDFQRYCAGLRERCQAALGVLDNARKRVDAALAEDVFGQVMAHLAGSEAGGWPLDVARCAVEGWRGAWLRYGRLARALACLRPGWEEDALAGTQTRAPSL